MEGIESFLLSGICGPCLATVQQCADDTDIVHYHLGLHCLGLVHTCEVRPASVVAAFPILLSISVSKERLLVMVEPRYVNCSTTSSS